MQGRVAARAMAGVRWFGQGDEAQMRVARVAPLSAPGSAIHSGLARGASTGVWGLAQTLLWSYGGEMLPL
jgi:hypothetical protein